MQPRQTVPIIRSEDRAVQQLQAQVAALQQQLSERNTGATRQLYRGDNRGGFSEAARGLQQTHHELDTADFFITATHDHFVIYAVQPLELTEVYWIPDDDYENGDAEYSFIRIHDHAPPYDKPPTAGRELGYISGQTRTYGEWATGDLKAGMRYRFLLAENPRVGKGSIVTLDSEVTKVSARWPEGYVILCWRWL
jgi:hypothetical protein